MKSDFQIDVSRLTSPTATQLFWLHHLEQWQKTTLSLADYARQQDLKYDNLHSWLRWGTQAHDGGCQTGFASAV